MKRFDFVVAREYESNGEKRTQWQNCGVVFEKNGKMWGNMWFIPTNWDGRFNLFEPKAKEQEAPTPTPTPAPAPQQAKQDDLPF